MKARLCAVIAAFVVAAAAWSQPQPPPGGGNAPASGFGMQSQAGPPHGDAMMENFFPPELVMRHQKDIALTADQQTAIRAELQKTVAKFTDLQWQQSAEEETMQALVKQDHPDEKEVLAQLDKLLAIENDLKRIQLGTLVRIKNILTPEQQTQLTELKKKMEQRMMPGMQGMQRGGADSSPSSGRNGAPPSGMPPGPGRGTSTTAPPPANPPSSGEGE
jgi:Spy/CpxP family protein refolding chaperone